VPYITKAVAAALGVSPPQLHEARLRARENAEPARAARPRPVVVVMPGWGLFMASLTALAQDLASNGYIVVGIDPAVGIEDPLTLPADVTNPGRRIEQLAAALSFVTGPRITALAGPVDPMRIAVGGHSIAGPVAFQTALTDPRVGAVFDLDGRLASSATRAFAQFPFLLVNASDLGPATTEIVARARNAVTVKLEGATHLDVTDIPCLAPAFGAGAKSLLGIGTIGCTGTTTTNTVVRRFLDAALQTRSTVPSAADLSKGLDGVIPAARPR
jgi:dienelactone hydrolase